MEGTNAEQHVVPLFLSASHEERESFMRVINRSLEGSEIRIVAIDDSGWRPQSVTLTIEANETVHFNSSDLEQGNTEKGLEGSVGSPAEGDWRLVLDANLDLEVLSYVRTEDGFLTSMHDQVPRAATRHRVSTFNPGRNVNQVSKLRLINDNDESVDVTIQGLDGNGESPGEDVEVVLEADEARTLTSQELESGEADGLTGALGTGAGKWQLIVTAEYPIVLMNLMESPTGHLTNLSTRPTISHVGRITDRFEAWDTRLEPKSWWKQSAPYSCKPAEKPDSPWREANLPDIGGSDPLSLVRYFGNGSYVRYGNMGFAGCTLMWKYPRATYLDAPADPTYYTPDVDISVDVARIPEDASGWPSEDRIDMTLTDTVSLLNEHVAPYFLKLSEGQFALTFVQGEEFEVPEDGSREAMEDRYREILGLECDDWPCSDYRSGALNRILFIDVDRLTSTAWNGSAQIGLANVQNANMKPIVHEIGHAWLLWPHSYAEVMWQPYLHSEITRPNPYSNYYDFMSDVKERSGWRQTLPATLAVNRYSAGWIAPENVALHVADSATYTLQRPYDGGYQFLVVNSGRPYAFTTLEIPDDRDPEYLEEHLVYDPDAPGEQRPFRYDGVLVSRFDQTTGTGPQARFGPALYDKRNPDYLQDVGWGRDDYSLIADGETRDIGGIDATVSRNPDGSYDVMLSGGRIAEFETWCNYRLGVFDTGCAFDDPR